MILLFRFGRPRFGVMEQSCISLLFPLAKLYRGHGISKAEGYELHDFPLLPMWQLFAVFEDVLRFVEKITHESVGSRLNKGCHD